MAQPSLYGFISGTMVAPQPARASLYGAVAATMTARRGVPGRLRWRVRTLGQTGVQSPWSAWWTVDLSSEAPDPATYAAAPALPDVPTLPSNIAATHHSELWRISPDGTETLIVDQLPPNASTTDDTPYTIGGTYRVVAVTSDGATASAIIYVDPDAKVSRSWWLNVTDLVAAITYRPNRDRTSSLAQTVEHYAGRADPVVTYGEAVKRETSLTGVLILDEGTNWEMIEQIALTPEVAILRGPDGTRIPVAIPSTSAQDSNDRKQEVTLPVIRVGEDPVEPIIELV